MQRPLGCLTGAALLTGVLAIVAILVISVATGNGIFSPGRLNAEPGPLPVGKALSHADLERRCEACHPAPWAGERMADLCVVCHTAVGEEFASGAGLHGLLASIDSCRSCHTEHRGTDASLTLADLTGFPHERTGYALTAHRVRSDGGTFACGDCHPASLATLSQQTCLECHDRIDPAMMGPHVQTFGATCLPCHDGKDTYGAAFEHRTYPLVGGHEQAACGSCHEGARDLFALQATSTTCVVCHREDDIHEGRLGARCDECHTPSTWAEADIDHDRTRFKLTGRHAGGECLGCHVDRQWVGIGTTCVGCHREDDTHDGTLGTDCAACHGTSSWSDVSFDHSKTSFSLTGAHRDASCQQCHRGGVFTGTPTACAACHARPASHTRQFNGCAACHTTRAWRPASFDVSHRFPVRHGDAEGVCTTCHPSSWADYTCARCHSTSKMTEEHKEVPGYAPADCVRCHPTGRDD